MDFTPASRPADEAPNAPRPAVTYRPTRTSPSVAGATAPIAGADKPVQIRGAPVLPLPKASAAPAATEEPATEGEETADELAQRADLSKRLGLIAEKERKAREAAKEAAKETAAKTAELKALEERIAEREKRISEWEARDAERRRNPRKALEDFGFSPEAALTYLMNKEKLTPEQEQALRVDEALAQQRQQTAAELQKLREEQAEKEKARAEEEERRQKEAAEAEERQAVEEAHADIAEIIAGDKDAFPILGDSQAAAEVVFAAVREWSDAEAEKSGRRPLVTTKVYERFARQVEEQAQKEVAERAERLGYAPAAAPRRPQTLANTLPSRRAAAVPAPEAPQRPETDAERRKRMISFLDQLKARSGGSLR